MFWWTGHMLSSRKEKPSQAKHLTVAREPMRAGLLYYLFKWRAIQIDNGIQTKATFNMINVVRIKEKPKGE